MKVVGGSGESHPGVHAESGRGTRRREPAASRKVLALPAKTAGKPSAVRRKPLKGGATPEEVIPMNDGEFKDF